MSSKIQFGGRPSVMEPISSANTITAASSRFDLNASTQTTPLDRTARNSNVDLNTTIPMAPFSTMASTLVSSPSPPSKRKESYINEMLDLRRADIVVIATCFITGLTDSAMFANYSIFTSMQSGNTIFMGLAVSGQTSNRFVAIRCIFSMIAYVVGVFFFSRMHSKFLAPKSRRITVALNYAIQGILTMLAAGIIQGELVSRYGPVRANSSSPQQWDSLAPIFLLSFSAAGQIMAARSLAVSHIPTVVVTTMLAELFSDLNLFKLSNTGRNQRMASLIMMFLGAAIGGLIDKASMTIQASLWLAGGLKFAAVTAMAFWPAESTSAKDDLEGQRQGMEIKAPSSIQASGDSTPEKTRP